MDWMTAAELAAAREIVRAHMAATPSLSWPLLNQRTGGETWVKHENHGPIGAFKVRGGLVYMTRLKDRDPDLAGVITATTGNHGQSVGRAARMVGLAATIVVPKGNNPGKNAAMAAQGAELIEHGDDFQAAREYAEGLAAERGLHMVPAFHPWLVQGVASYALELFEAQPGLARVYVPIGLGSGICGVIAARDALGLETEVVGVVAEGAAGYALSFAARKVIGTNGVDTVAEGLAVRQPDATALEIILKGAADVVTVSDDEIMAAIAAYFTDTHNLAEGAGAAPLAALLRDRGAMAGKKTGVILSGGNIGKDLLVRVLAGPVAGG
jgi:threonine dehydratase